jgi:hypothetical protein
MDAVAEFAAVDKDGSGSIRFDEFSYWALAKQLGGSTHERGDGSAGGGDASGGDGLHDLPLPPEHVALADASRLAADRKRDDEEEMKHVLHLRWLRLQPLLPHTPGKPIPIPPRAKLKEMLRPRSPPGSPIGTEPTLTRRQKAFALRYAGRYSSQYKKRMVAEMALCIRTPQSDSPRAALTARLPGYESERLLARLEKPSEPSSPRARATSPRTLLPSDRRLQAVAERARQARLLSQPSWGLPAVQWSTLTAESLKALRARPSPSTKRGARREPLPSQTGAHLDAAPASPRAGASMWEWPNGSPRALDSSRLLLGARRQSTTDGRLEPISGRRRSESRSKTFGSTHEPWSECSMSRGGSMTGGSVAC